MVLADQMDVVPTRKTQQIIRLKVDVLHDIF
jgi:hypothetical protein